MSANGSPESSPTAANIVRSRIQELVHRAVAKTGLSNFGGDSWREGLEVLVSSAESEAAFNAYGEQAFISSLMQPLVNRLQIEDWYTRHPEIDEQSVEIELLGVGFPRTGSTALAYMLAEDDAYRNLRGWEDTQPCPPPGLSEEADGARIAAAQRAVDQGQSFMAERLKAMLPQSATGPIEDHALMALEFKAQVFLVGARVPSYAEWLLDCAMEPTYLYEKRALKLLQWKTHRPSWRLKSPTHTLFLEDFEKVFPTTRFVQTHREVSKFLPSVCDLYYTLLQIGNENIDTKYVGELNLQQWGTALDRCLQFRQDPRRDQRFHDIAFQRFQTEPVNEITRLYEWLDEPLGEPTQHRMTAWRASNPRDQHGVHVYSLEDFGISVRTLAERFAPYTARFTEYLA